MCFHGNQHPWATKHPLINSYSKYQSFKFICLPVMNSPVFPSLDDIYCIYLKYSNFTSQLCIRFDYDIVKKLILIKEFDLTFTKRW